MQQPLTTVALAQTVDDLKEHLLISHFIGKAVGAEQNALVAAQTAGKHIALHLRLGADGAGNDVFARMKLGLFLREFAALDHVSDHRVVARNEAHVFACKMIGAAIADVDDDGQIAADPDGDERCAHAR